MKLVMYIGQVKQAISTQYGEKLATYLEVAGKHTTKMLSETPMPNSEVEIQCSERLEEPWAEIIYRHVMAGRAVVEGRFQDAYTEQNLTLSVYLRELHKTSNWSLETLYVFNKDLYRLAVKADAQLVQRGEPAVNLEDSARAINKSFTACITDRSPLGSSKKWGTYQVACVLFRAYFRLNSHGLCKNILRAIRVADLPDLVEFPMAHQVTMRYYMGVLASLDEDFVKAEPDLQFAFDHTPPEFRKHRCLILEFLIPARLLRGSLPPESLLQTFPELAKVYRPLIQGIKTGDLRLFDDALALASDRLMTVGTYLTVEMSRQLALRTLFKRTYRVAGGSNKMKMDVFQHALECVGVTIDADEVACIIANMIFKRQIRGYISPDNTVLVLSNVNPFPRLPMA